MTSPPTPPSLAFDDIRRAIPAMDALPDGDTWTWWPVHGPRGVVAFVGTHESPGQVEALYLYSQHAVGAVRVDITGPDPKTVLDVSGDVSTVLSRLTTPESYR